jgi:hypothetical protein
MANLWCRFALIEGDIRQGTATAWTHSRPAIFIFCQSDYSKIARTERRLDWRRLLAPARTLGPEVFVCCHCSVDPALPEASAPEYANERTMNDDLVLI